MESERKKMRNKIYFIADLHLGHKNIIFLAGRPFDSIEEMNTQLIRNWNNTIRKGDRVFFLGDFALAGREQKIEWGRQLQGIKHIVLGNHDTKDISLYTEMGFRTVSRYPIIFEEFILSHKPVTPPKGMINIHGHSHDREPPKDNSFCVSVEQINYTPIEIQEIRNRGSYFPDGEEK